MGCVPGSSTSFRLLLVSSTPFSSTCTPVSSTPAMENAV